MWSWLTLGYAYPRLLELVTTVTRQTPDEAEAMLLSLLQRWHRDGLLQIQETSDG